MCLTELGNFCTYRTKNDMKQKVLIFIDWFAPGYKAGGPITSNVNIVDEMVNMISVTRAYETNQKVIQTYDSSLDAAVNQIGKI